MHVNNYSGRLLLQSDHFFFGHLEWTVKSRHVGPTHQLEDAKLFPTRRLDYNAPMTRHTIRVVSRSKETWFSGKVVEYFLLIPGMIPGRNYCEAEIEQFFCKLRRNSKPPRRIFSISDHDVDLPLSYKPWNGSGYRATTRLSKNIANKEDLHLAYSTYRLSRITVTRIVPG